MHTPAALPALEGEPLNEEQTQYLTGFFAGIAARGLRFSEVEPSLKPPREDLIFEERVKHELHPLDAYEQLLDLAAANRAPEKDDLFRFKWSGLFYLSPAREGYMAWLRIPGGHLMSFQLRELARVAEQLTSGHVQITTRANLQMRLIQPKDTPELLSRIQAVGLHTRGAGADNIRNLTANPTAGIDPLELIDVMPLCREMGQIILNDRAFYDLPRKFNVAYDGGGLIGTLEDTNDLGAKAVLVDGKVFFRIAAGGASGHKAFARDLGILVPPGELNRTLSAMIRVFIAHGNRSDRKKARLKHLLENWSLERFVQESEKLLPAPLTRAPLGALEYPSETLAHSHIGVHPQKQPGLHYIGAGLPVGQITPKQMHRLAGISEAYGTGELRLTVWQNVILPNIPTAFVETVRRELRRLGLSSEMSHMRSGLIACTGNTHCKFAQTNTKGHAAELADHLERRIPLDHPINIHLTGCPNSCAQHYIGDIGLLGTKTKVSGESVEGYHVFVGGGFGSQQAIGRQVFTGIPFGELKSTLENMLRGYLLHREPGETFRSFTQRHDLNRLQRIFSEQQ